MDNCHNCKTIHKQVSEDHDNDGDWDDWGSMIEPLDYGGLCREAQHVHNVMHDLQMTMEGIESDGVEFVFG